MGKTQTKVFESPWCALLYVIYKLMLIRKLIFICYQYRIATSLRRGKYISNHFWVHFPINSSLYKSNRPSLRGSDNPSAYEKLLHISLFVLQSLCFTIRFSQAQHFHQLHLQIFLVMILVLFNKKHHRTLQSKNQNILSQRYSYCTNSILLLAVSIG